MVKYEIQDWRTLADRLGHWTNRLDKAGSNRRNIHHLDRLRLKILDLKNGIHSFTPKQVCSIKFALSHDWR